MRAPLQPDQQTGAWAAFVGDYEAVFEPLTDCFARAAFELAGPLHGREMIDVACGPGGAAVLAARLGARVLAIDASRAMVERVTARAASCGASDLRAMVMDASALDAPDGTFDLAYSAFGIVLLPEPLVPLRELRRVLGPRGRAIVVTWTETHLYELAAHLGRAIESVRGVATPPSGPMPAQLRYADRAAFRHLFLAAGFGEPAIHRLTASLVVASATVLADRLAFAPGMAALVDGLGDDRAAVIARFVAGLEAAFGAGPVTLGAVAHVGIADRGGSTRPATTSGGPA